MVHEDNRYEAIRKSLELVDDQIDWRTKHKIVVKLNFISPANQLACTHVEAAKAVLEHLKEKSNKKILLVEGSMESDPLAGFRKLGFFPLTKRYNIRMVNLNQTPSIPLQVCDKKLRSLSIYVSELISKADCVISLTPPKTHDAVIFSASLKNLLMGSLITENLTMFRKARRKWRHIRHSLRLKWEARWEPLKQKLPEFIRNSGLMFDLEFLFLRNLCLGDSKFAMHQSLPVLHLNLALLARHIRPDLCVIDAHEAMEGAGPDSGTPVPYHISICGTDPIAVDSTMARIMGFNPKEIGYLFYSHLLGLGNLEDSKIEVLGNVAIKNVVRKVTPHPWYRYQKEWQSQKCLALIESLMRRKT